MKRFKFFQKKKGSIATMFFIILFFYSLNLLPEEIFFPLIEEDGLFENLTAIFFLLTSVSFLLLFIRPDLLRKSKRRALFSTKFRRYAFLLLALVFFFGFGEEISWGQRIFGFATPESMLESNAQDEFNIHNLEIFNVRDNEGADRSTWAKLFTMKQLFLYAFVFYLLVMPLLEKNSTKLKELFKRLFIPIPPLWLGLVFVGNYALYRIFRLFTDQKLDPNLNNGLTEIQELNFAIILLLVPFTLMRFKKKHYQKFLKLS